MALLIAQDYAGMWALVLCLGLLGMLAVAAPRFRRADLVPLDAKKKKSKPKRSKPKK